MDAEKIFADSGALQKGHFLLTSGLHSDTYLQCALVLQHPHLAQQLAEEMARKLVGQRIDVVVGPAMGGVTWAYQERMCWWLRMSPPLAAPPRKWCACWKGAAPMWWVWPSSSIALLVNYTSACPITPCIS